MKNFLSKSSEISPDFQKFFNLILTEQRAQRVDLARIYRLIKNTPDDSEEDIGNSDSE